MLRVAFAHGRQIVLVAGVCAFALTPAAEARGQLSWGVVGGLAFGKRDVEHPVNPYTGFVDPNYAYFPDSALHWQAGLSIEGLGRYFGIRLTALYMTAGVIDVTANGKRLLVCGGQICSDTLKYNPYPGHVARYLAADVDLIFRTPGADEEMPFDAYLLAGPSVRRRLRDASVRDLFENDDLFTGAISAGGGFHIWLGGPTMLLEYRHGFGLGSHEPRIGGLEFQNPNREAQDVVRLGLTFPF